MNVRVGGVSEWGGRNVLMPWVVFYRPDLCTFTGYVWCLCAHTHTHTHTH